jgi:predicted nucleic acid-binding protein
MQQANYRVLLDACVLANYGICDLFLRLAETPRQFVPLWSEEILDETYRTQINALKWDKKIADSFRVALETNFPEAMAGDYAALLDRVCNDPKDHHVLAAAIHEQASLIVTFNVKDFPPASLKPWSLEVKHPQDYLLNLYSINPVAVLARLSAMATKRGLQLGGLMNKLGASVPAFTKYVLQDIGEK